MQPLPRPLALALLCVVLPAQEDLDRIVLRGGKEVLGRIERAYHPDPVTIYEGGSRKRIERKQIQTIDRLNDRLREFFTRRDRRPDDLRWGLMLAEWARTQRLPGMAELQAWSLLRKHPADERLRAFLGHRKVGKRWMIKAGNRWLDREGFDKKHSKWGRALVMESPHFKLRTDAGIDAGVDILLDLERFYLHFEDTFGKGLDMFELRQRLEVKVWRSAYDFPAVSARKQAYHDVANRHVLSFYAPGGRRPQELFGVCTQALLYSCIAGQARSMRPAHLCAWIEIGLSQYMDAQFTGPPGAARHQPVTLAPLVRSSVLQMRSRLNRLVHMQYPLFLELGQKAAIRRNTAWALAHHLMGDGRAPKIRQRFLALLDLAYRQGQGDSSTALQKALGQTEEQLDAALLEWLRTLN